MKLEKSLKKFLFSKEKRIAHCYPSFYLEDSTQANVWKGGRGSKAQLYSQAIVNARHVELLFFSVTENHSPFHCVWTEVGI